MVNRWYVAQTKPQLEKFAADQLHNQNFNSFCPQHRQKCVYGGKPTIRIFPLFPSYIFVQLDFDKDRWRSVHGTRGVVRLLSSFDDYALPLPVGFVEKLIESRDKDGFIPTKNDCLDDVLIDPGTKLLIKDNNFNGLTGICVSSTQKRVVLLLSLLSREVKVNLKRSMVEAIQR